jgi:predicted nucleic acid-binding protein
MQYTIRGIPLAVDHALRARARATGKSLNEAAVEALAEGAGVAGARRKQRDLGDIAGTWKAEKAVEMALADQDRIDDPTTSALRRFLLKDGVRLRKQGTPIPTNDMWLAALVLQHNLALHARDKHFDHLPQIVRV